MIVKQMTHNETAEDKERARRDILYEANTVSALADHSNLCKIFGRVIKTLPIVVSFPILKIYAAYADSFRRDTYDYFTFPVRIATRFANQLDLIHTAKFDE